MSLFNSTNTAAKPMFGGSLNQQPATGSTLFGGFGSTQNQAQQPQQQQQQQSNTLLGASLGAPQQQQNGNSRSLWNPGSLTPREANVPEQIKTIVEKWDTGNQKCVFQHYFYNKVDEASAPYYRPSPAEDEQAWEEALSKKPGPGFIPVLCVGFAQMGERIKLQQAILAQNNRLLHEINESLEAILRRHGLEHTVRIMEANRRHQMLKKRCISLATKVQVLRNRGYAMGGEEEDLKVKLQELEKQTFDPGLSARSDEIWSRMLVTRDRAALLRAEIARRAQQTEEQADENLVKRAQQILEDFSIQLSHLKKELESINQSYTDWEKEQGPKKR